MHFLLLQDRLINETDYRSNRTGISHLKLTILAPFNIVSKIQWSIFSVVWTSYQKMAAQNQPSALRSIIDIVGFLLLAVAHIIYAIIKAAIPNSYKQHKSIKNEIVLITGGGGGLGKLLSLRLAKLGAIIVVWDVNESGKSD